jgi:hypothetical protein
MPDCGNHAWRHPISQFQKSELWIVKPDGKAGHYGKAKAGRDHRLHGRVVVRAIDDVRLDPGGREIRFDQFERAAWQIPDHGKAGEVGRSWFSVNQR